MDLYSFSVYTYLAFFTVLLSFCYHYCKDNRIKFLFLTILYIGTVAFWSIRYNIGFDYQGYVEIWNDVRHERATYSEPLFTYVSSLFPQRDGYMLVFFVMSSLSYFLLIYALKYQKIIWPGMLMSLSFLLQFMAANQVRQALAICMLLCLAKPIQEKKHFIWISGVVTIGVIAHTSTLFLLLIIPFCYIKIPNKVWTLIIICVYLLYLAGVFRSLGTFLMTNFPFLDRFEIYTTTARMESENIGFSIVVLYNIAVSLFLAWNYRCRNNSLFNLYMIGMVMYVMFTEFHLILRLSFYLTNVGILIISEYCNSRKKYGTALEIISLSYFILLCTRPTNYHGVIPFQTIFDR